MRESRHFQEIGRPIHARVLSTCAAMGVAFLAMATLARGGDFEMAGDLYDGGKFAEAKQRYEELIQHGQRSANLFYNLGNAEYRLGERGRAALNYERALTLEPGHPEASANLRLVREQAGSRVPEVSWMDWILPRLRGDTFALAAAAAAWLAIGCLAAIALRGATAGWLAGFFACLLAAASSGIGVWRDSREASLGIVVAKQVEARLAPADRAGLAESLPAGSRVRVRSERGEWIYCDLPGKGLGWIPSDALEKVRLSAQ